MRSVHKFQKGFTIAELLVVIAIIGVMTTLVLVNFQSGRHSTELRGVSTKLLQDIRLAQSYTIAGNSYSYCQPVYSSANVYMSCRLYSDCGSTADLKACKNTTPTNGYGIYIGDRYAYQMFGDTQPDGVPNAGVDYGVINQDNQSKNVSIIGYRVSPSITPVHDQVDTPLSITFSPPEGVAKIYLDGAIDTTITNVEIVLRNSHISDFCRRVSVNLISGQVSENQGSCGI